MHTYKTELISELHKKEQYREMLFRRGYLITNREISGSGDYPFYDQWIYFTAGDYNFYIHRQQTYFIAVDNNIKIVLIGHAYNPFSGDCEEEAICRNLLTAYSLGKEIFFNKISELTGLYVIAAVDRDRLILCQDACSLTGCYYAKVGNNMYVAEHAQLIADLCNLETDPMADRLILSRCYNIGNRHLPGDLTLYKKVRRLGANTYLSFNGRFAVKRFFPTGPHPEFNTETEKEAAARKIGDLIHRGIECCTKKWGRCAISLTGGIDSRTTLACANGLYERLSVYSYDSKPQELVDAEAARSICSKLGLEHTLYHIPESNNDFIEFDLIKKILRHNTGYIKDLADNEIRKYIYFHDLDAFDIELKSWASEVGRVFLERKYQVNMPDILNERECSIFQTRYFGHPRLLRWSDQMYYMFLRKIHLDKPLFNYEHADLFYWEIRMGCWGVSVISSQQLYHRMTIPMNNRKILELLLGFPHDDRKSDSVHKRIMAYENKAVLYTETEVMNLYFHKYRIWMEKAFYLWRTAFYRPIKEKEEKVL